MAHERLELSQLIADNLTDGRHGQNTQLPLPDLLRQSISPPACHPCVHLALSAIAARAQTTEGPVVLACCNF